MGDLHGDLAAVDRAIAQFRPDALVCVGDWGDPADLTEAELARLANRLPAATVSGNHDPLDWLGRVRDARGGPILLGPGEVRTVAGLRVAGISGIWAKSHRQPWYVTDDDVAAQARQIAASGPLDLLLTHGCPIGLADQTASGTRGGQRCFLLANQAIAPQVHLCGHLHVAQERTLKDGRQVCNVGLTPGGSVVIIDLAGGRPTAHLARIDEPARGERI